ncbi:MAG: tryptophan-rich sensory protein [Patescibacteria group bacterium]|nr:tryptophan-rich sensory protein [Patescibacteria group bacterium]
MEKDKMILALKLIASLVICQIAGFIGAIFTTPAVTTWYTTLNKPFFNPPSSIFAPVWTVLFIAMGIALFLVWTKTEHAKEKKLAILLFSIQLAFNVLWSVVFFGLHSPFIGILVILILLALIIATTIKFYKLSEIAGMLMVPYALWVGFATVLNIAVFILNR